MNNALPMLAAIPSDCLWTAFYVLPYVGLVAYLVRRFGLLASADRKTLARVSAVALAGAVVWAALIHLNPWSQIWEEDAAPAGDLDSRRRTSIFYHQDDFTYSKVGREVAERWRLGERPALWLDSELGTLHTGFYRFIAAIYFVTGPRPTLILLLNLLACAALPMAVYFLANDFAGARVAKRAAWMAALYPSFWFHSAFVMRDVWSTLFFLTLLGMCFDMERRRESSAPRAVWRWIFLAFVSMQVFILRFYLLVIVAAAWSMYELFLGPHRRRAVLVFGTAVVGAAALRVVPNIAALQNQIVMGPLWGIPADLDSPARVAVQFAGGIAKFFLAPLPWATHGGYTIDYFLWPGQWILYLLILPFGLWGMVWAARNGPRQSLILILPFAVAAWGFILFYGGSAARQRMFIDPLLMIFAAIVMAWERPSRRFRIYLAGYYAILALGILGHVASLFVRGIWGWPG